MVDTSKVLEKVRKMMALANDAGASEGERDNAMRMAFALLTKHNLDESDLDVTENRQRADFITSQGSPWARIIASSIAKLYFCNYFSQLGGGTKFKHVFVGKTSNATTAHLMADYVIKSVTKEAAKQTKAEGRSSTWKTSFVKGAANVIHHRCNEMIAAQSNEVHTRGNGTTVALSSIYKTEKEENEAFIKDELGYNLRSSKSRERPAGYDGFNAGAAFGKGVGLNTQVSNGSQLRIG